MSDGCRICKKGEVIAVISVLGLDAHGNREIVEMCPVARNTRLSSNASSYVSVVSNFKVPFAHTKGVEVYPKPYTLLYSPRK